MFCRIPLLILTLTISSFALAGQKAYVNAMKGNAVSVLDLYANQLNTIVTLPAPESMTMTPDGRFLYIADSGANTITVIDTSTDGVIASIEVGAEPQGMVITNDGKQLLVTAQGSGNVIYIDTASNTVQQKLSIPDAHDIVLNAANTKAYIASQQPDKYALVVVNVPKKAIERTVRLKNAPRAMHLGPDENYFYFTAAGIDGVEVLDTKTYQIIKHIPTAPSPYAITFTHDGKWGLTASQKAGILYVFDPKTNVVTNKIPVGKQPHWIVVSSDNKTVYVTNEGSNTISVVDLDTKKVIHTIPAKDGPHKMVLQPLSREVQTTPFFQNPFARLIG